MIYRLVIFGLVLILSSCGPKVYIDYDTESNFEKYQSYNFYDPSNSGLNELDNERVMSAVEEQLDSIDREQNLRPDFSIEFYVRKYVKNQPHNVGISLGGGAGGIGGSVPVNSEKEMISLTINFADALTDELFWQAVIEAEYNTDMKPQEKKVFYKNLVKEALANYPPNKEE